MRRKCFTGGKEDPLQVADIHKASKLIAICRIANVLARESAEETVPEASQRPKMKIWRESVLYGLGPEVYAKDQVFKALCCIVCIVSKCAQDETMWFYDMFFFAKTGFGWTDF